MSYYHIEENIYGLHELLTHDSKEREVDCGSATDVHARCRVTALHVRISHNELEQWKVEILNVQKFKISHQSYHFI